MYILLYIAVYLLIGFSVNLIQRAAFGGYIFTTEDQYANEDAGLSIILWPGILLVFTVVFFFSAVGKSITYLGKLARKVSP